MEGRNLHLRIVIQKHNEWNLHTAAAVWDFWLSYASSFMRGNLSFTWIVNVILNSFVQKFICKKVRRGIYNRRGAVLLFLFIWTETPVVVFPYQRFIESFSLLKATLSKSEWEVTGPSLVPRMLFYLCSSSGKCNTCLTKLIQPFQNSTITRLFKLMNI